MSASPRPVDREHRPTVHPVRPESARRAPVGVASLVLGGKYRLDRPIASGGMASVWSATHVTLNRPVAVKFVDAGDADDTSRIERFLREAKVAASIRHKNVVDILDFGVHERENEPPEPYMIMELLDGEALDQKLARGPIDTSDAVSIMRQVLSGLDAVHTAGIVHRDLKPGNVFLTDDHDGLFARVLDFGISQGADETPAAERVVVGTPEYMSPEQAWGDPLDHRSDVYSAGVILYEMLGGVLPFEDRDPLVVIRLVAEGTARPLVERRPEIPAICAVVEKAMSRKPEERYATARAMHRALSEAWGMVDVTGRHSVPGMSVPISGQYLREATTLDAEPKAPVAAPSVPPPASATPRRAILAALVVLALIAIAVVALGGRSTPDPQPGPSPVATSPATAPPVVARAVPAAPTPPPTVAAEPQAEAAPPAEAPETVPAASGADAPSTEPAPRAPRRVRTERGSIRRELDF